MSWIRGQIILSLFLGIGVFVGLNLLALLGVKGIQYTLLLAVLAAVVAPIPYIGNYLAVFPVVHAHVPIFDAPVTVHR